MYIVLADNLDLTGCKTPEHLGQRFAGSAACYLKALTFEDVYAFLSAVTDVMVDTGHDFHINMEEWHRAYAAYLAARAQKASLGGG